MSKISGYTNGAPLLGSDVWPVARAGAMRGIAGKDSLVYHTRRNFLDNPLFNVAQRGTTIALTTAAAVGLDRWGAMQATSAGGTVQQQNTGASARVKLARVGRTAAVTNTGTISFAQALETQDASILAGQPVCFAFEARGGAQFSAASGHLDVKVVYGTGIDQSLASMLAGGWTGYTSLTLNASAAVLTPATAAYAFTANVPAAATQIGVIVSYVPVGTAGADDGFYIQNCWFGYGDSPPPIWNNPNPMLEKAQCMRHLQGLAGVGFRILGAALSTVLATFPITLVVPMRAAPTIAMLSAAGDFTVFSASAGTTGVCTGGIALTVAGVETASVNGGFTAGTPTVAAGQAMSLLGNNANAKLLLGAEL